MSGPDERFERALGGSPLPAEDELAAFVAEVRQAFPARPMLAEQAHLAAIADAARRLSPEARPDQTKEPQMAHPDVKFRFLDVKFGRIRSRAAAVVAGLVVAMMSFGGLAFAGVLPNGVQSRLADVAAAIGVELPDGDDVTEALEVDDDELETETPEPSETESPTADDRDDEDEKSDDREKQADDERDEDQGDDRDENHESAQHESGDHDSDDSDQHESDDDRSGGDRESSSDDEDEHESSSDEGGEDEHDSEDAGEDHESGDD